MKATIIRNIEKEIREIYRYSPVHLEAEKTGLNQVVKEGEVYNPFVGKTIAYEGVQIWNPELKAKELYYVKTDDKKLFKDLTIVSNHFVEEQVRQSNEKLLWEFEIKQANTIKSTKEKTIKEIKGLPFWKRLLNKF